jgi:hypothetical protein
MVFDILIIVCNNDPNELRDILDIKFLNSLKTELDEVDSGKYSDYSHFGINLILEKMYN